MNRQKLSGCLPGALAGAATLFAGFFALPLLGRADTPAQWQSKQQWLVLSAVAGAVALLLWLLCALRRSAGGERQAREEGEDAGSGSFALSLFCFFLNFLLLWLCEHWLASAPIMRAIMIALWIIGAIAAYAFLDVASRRARYAALSALTGLAVVMLLQLLAFYAPVLNQGR